MQIARPFSGFDIKMNDKIGLKGKVCLWRMGEPNIHEYDSVEVAGLLRILMRTIVGRELFDLKPCYLPVIHRDH
jgi:hypothetical protein